jgi:hypothetical protein
LEIYKRDKTIRTGEIFDILDRMFGNVDAYCSDPNLITDPKYDIAEVELRKRAKRTLAELSAIPPSLQGTEEFDKYTVSRNVLVAISWRLQLRREQGANPHPKVEQLMPLCLKHLMRYILKLECFLSGL